jgi:hypothetical protein
MHRAGWLRRCAPRADARSATVAFGAAQCRPAYPRLVPQALELCHAGPDVADQARDHGLRRNDASLAARARLARIRWVYEQLECREAMVYADELDVHLLPKVGCTWMPKGTQVEVMTPGQNQKHYLAGSLDLTTGTLRHCLGVRKTNALFRNLLALLETSYPADRYTQIYVVLDNYHKAKAIEYSLAAHSRMRLLFLPAYCPRANPIERAFGDVHDCGTRNHRRKRLPDLIADVKDHLRVNGPWQYKLSEFYYEPAITAAVEKITAEEHTTVAA